jgi:prolipoprotein diacylglyceryltransferase
VTFPPDASATKVFGPVSVLPSQLFASAGALLVLAILLLLEKVWDYRGATFGRFLFLYGLSRFLVDFTRYYEPEQVMTLGWNNNQWISVGMMVLGLVTIISCARRSLHREEPVV